MTDFQEFTFLSSDGTPGSMELSGPRRTGSPLPFYRSPTAWRSTSCDTTVSPGISMSRASLWRAMTIWATASPCRRGPAGVFRRRGTWETVVDDIHLLHQRLREQYPRLPILLMGHSMGSFLSRTYLIRYPGTVDAAIIMGTGWQPEMTIRGRPAAGGCYCQNQGAGRHQQAGDQYGLRGL